MAIIKVKEVLDDEDGTVGYFSVNYHTNEGYVIMNYQGNPELVELHQWYTDNDNTIPAYSSTMI
jgi:hypothetical protein